MRLPLMEKWGGIPLAIRILVSIAAGLAVAPQLAAEPVLRYAPDPIRHSGLAEPTLDRLIQELRRVPVVRSVGAVDFNVGYVTGPVHFSLSVVNLSAGQAQAVLGIPYTLLDQVQLYQRLPEGDRLLVRRAGRALGVTAGTAGEIDFRLWAPPGATELLLRVESQDSLSVPLRLRTPDESRRHRETASLFYGTYYGAIGIMALYNFFLFLTLRDRSYLYYVLTLLSLHGSFQLALNGLGAGVMGAGSLWLTREAIVWALGLGVYSGILFARAFLHTVTYATLAHRILGALRFAALALLPISTFLPHFVAVQIGILVGSSAAIATLLAAWLALRQGFRPAFFFLLAWTALLAGALLYSLKALGVLPANFFTESSMQVGMAAEALLLSFALGDRYNLLRRQKQEAQQDSLEQERRARRSQAELIEHLRRSELLKNEVLALESEGLSMQDLLEKILAALHEILRFRAGFAAVSDRSANIHLQSFPRGTADTGLRDMISGDRFVKYLLHVPPDLFPYLNLVQLTRPQTPEVFGEAGELQRSHPEHVSIIRMLLAELRRHEIRVIVALSFRKEIFGYVLLGDAEQSYSPAEVSLLEAFRTSLALAIRNFSLFEELRELKGRAEVRVSRLAQYIDEVTPAVLHTVQDRSLVYASASMRGVLDSARKMAEQSLPVLITGETGTGKELIARTIHDSSAEARGPFVAVNCAAVPASLWESEIFGHEKGAFTDARQRYSGRVEQAANGTLFFDEIGELPLDIQPKLLRLLQERKFFRLGGRETLEARCRFVFATNRNLEEMQRTGQFREDLYYRVSVLEVRLPPLRDRRADIPVLTRHFIERFSRELRVDARWIDDEAMETLQRYDWPGNIREMENVLIQAVLHSEDGGITRHSLPPQLRREGVARDESGALTAPPVGHFDEALRTFTRNLILRALEQARGNKQEAARLLGIKRATFYYKLKELGLR